jgi:hypothetical protein
MDAPPSIGGRLYGTENPTAPFSLAPQADNPPAAVPQQQGLNSLPAVPLRTLPAAPLFSGGPGQLAKRLVSLDSLLQRAGTDPSTLTLWVSLGDTAACIVRPGDSVVENNNLMFLLNLMQVSPLAPPSLFHCAPTPLPAISRNATTRPPR